MDQAAGICDSGELAPAHATMAVPVAHPDEVVDELGRFAGLIPPQRMLTVLLEEHDEDVSRLSGVLHAREAVVESIARRLWHRLPWLLLGLVGALLSAGIVGAFEDQLARRVMLAFFIPGVVYIADAVGTQTEAIIIRGLSVGIPVRAVLFREAVTGLAIGMIIAAAFVPIGLLVWGEPDVVLAVGLALLVACGTAARPAPSRSRVRRGPVGHGGTGPALDRDLLRDRPRDRRLTGRPASRVSAPGRRAGRPGARRALSCRSVPSSNDRPLL
ncbi:MAG: magnesium transporter [Actinobacteria bacterium]|nr:magnesium transporter [Actinomycetota bacterium]